MSSIKTIDNIPVIDAKHSITLHITRSDCNKADIKVPSNCAAAIAIRREFKVADCRVHLGRVYIRQNKGNWQRYQTPRSLRSEIIAFDRGGTFEPGEYTLAPLAPTQRLGKRTGTKSKYKHARNNPKRKPRKSPIAVKNVRNGPGQGDL